MKWASCKSALHPLPTRPPRTPTSVYSTDRSKAVVPVLFLFFATLWFILRGDLFYVLPCVILFLCCFSPFSIEITSLGEERATLSAFSTFVRFVLVWFGRFPLPLCVWEGLRFVIMAFPGHFSYPYLSVLFDNYPPDEIGLKITRELHRKYAVCKEATVITLSIGTD